MCSGIWCVGRLGVFRAGWASVFLDPHLGWDVVDAPPNRLSPPVKYFTDTPKAVLFVDILCFFCLWFAVPLYASVYMCLEVIC